MTNNKLVKDYQGNIIPKSKAHKIMDKYYEENVSCFLMEDGQWYRKTSSDKIIFDNYLQKYVLKHNCHLLKGIINSKGEEGYFSENNFVVHFGDIRFRKPIGSMLNEDVALAMGYIECFADGVFYKKDHIISDTDKEYMKKKAIPNNERSKSYNLESDPERKKELEKSYKDLKLKIEPSSIEIGKIMGNFTFGMEVEVINGHLPRRIRSKYALKALKDGSLRHEDGEGIEYCTSPMAGAKGIQVIKESLREMNKRCEVNNYCSVHFHFGNVRMDKLYVLSLYKTIQLIQDELKMYFPYSRLNSIKADGKIYCNPLPDLKIDYAKLLTCKDEQVFRSETLKEFNKFYMWLNNGKPLAEEWGDREIKRETVIRNGKKMFHDVWLKNMYTTKDIHHSVQGQKWDKPVRYSVFNFLNLFFSNIHTIESRLHEGSTNVTKILSWMLISVAILKYAENIKRGLSNTKLMLSDILDDQLPTKYSTYLLAYLKHRHDTFFNDANEYKSWKSIEKLWFTKDSEFKFVNNNFEIK